MRFKRIYIEITNTCNLTCDFCIQNQRAPRRMSVEEFEHIIKEVRPYSDYVYLHVLGEPLSHPDIAACLQILKAANMQVNVTTNGTLLKERREVLLEGGIRQLNVSLHSFPQHYQQTYIADAFQLCEEVASHKVHVNYRLWSLQDGKLTPETALILQQIEERYDCTLQEEQIRRLQRFDLAPYIHLHFEQIFTWPSLQQPFLNTLGKCLGMKQMCGILSDGSVVACCLDSKGDTCLGNIFEQSFSSILSSTRCEAMVKGFQNNQVVEELCQHCSYRLRFD